MSDDRLPAETSSFFLYSGKDRKVPIECRVSGETIWLTQKQLSELFDVGIPAVNKHLKNIFETGELEEAATVSKMEIVQIEGSREVSRSLILYNLDAIIAVGYRVNSYQATQFRVWATGVLKEMLIKGFVLDDERLKQGGEVFGKDYFDELLERIHEIRASERRFYQKVTDLYALSADYDPQDPKTKEFFATVQNKLHWAIAGQTAAELIYSAADAEKINMGLTTWKNAPDGRIQKSDTRVAKNYLDQAHIEELNRLVSAYLDLAANRAQRGIVMRMADWANFLNSFLELSNYPILTDSGKVSAHKAQLKAEAEYEVFRKKRDLEFRSDFDEEIKRIEGRTEGSSEAS